MKIDKRNPRHWLYLVRFSVNILCGVLFRWLAGSQNTRLVLYGHKLNGNLKALYDHLVTAEATRFDVRYLVVDPVYCRKLETAGVHVLNALRMRDCVAVCRAACVVTDHGPHALYFLQRTTSVKFVDVWHGIPFKGFDREDFHWLHGYDATFVPSPSMRRMYGTRYGFAPHQVKITGYARTDPLVTGAFRERDILDELGISETYRKLVLFAPTWHHGARNHSSIPFGLDADRFFSGLRELASQHNWLILFRAHLNSADCEPQSFPNIKFVPLADFPDTEALLFVTDVLVSDWSSIVFDFLALERPTIFMNTSPPFAKGFSYGPEYRFGPVVSDFLELTDNLRRSCEHPEDVLAEYGEEMRRVAREVYGDYLDGRAAQRYVHEIERLLVSD